MSSVREGAAYVLGLCNSQKQDAEKRLAETEVALGMLRAQVRGCFRAMRADILPVSGPVMA